MRRWRATWTTWDWVGAVALGVGAAIALVAFLGHRSGEWEVAATAWKDRMVEYGSWAGGAFAIGIGVLPAIALLALLAVPASERARPGVRAFVVVAGGAVVSFGWYAAIKGAYLSTAFSSLIVERNLVYLTPLAFVATAYLLMRAAAPVWAVAVSGAAVLAMVLWVPIDRGLDNFPYYEAHGLAILALANREWEWPLGRIEIAVVVVVLVSVAALLAFGTSLRPRSLGVAVPVAIAVAVLAWNVTAQVYASIGEHDFSARVEANIPKPNDWIDRAAGDGSVVMLGQRLSDNPLGVPTTEFWNRSIGKVWSVDGTGQAPATRSLPTSRASTARSGPIRRPTSFSRRMASRWSARKLPRTTPRGRRSSGSTAPSGSEPTRPGSRRTGGRSAHRATRRSRSGGLQPLRRLCGRRRHRRREALPKHVLPDGRPPAGSDKGSHRGARAGRRQATGDRPRDGLRDGLRAGLCVAHRGAETPDGPWRVEVETDTFVPAEVDPETSGSERRALGARVSFDVIPRYALPRPHRFVPTQRTAATR